MMSCVSGRCCALSRLGLAGLCAPAGVRFCRCMPRRACLLVQLSATRVHSSVSVTAAKSGGLTAAPKSAVLKQLMQGGHSEPLALILHWQQACVDRQS